MQITDMCSYTFDLPYKPRRIISLVPSQTELLADLGLEEEVAGITKFCVHPERWFRQKTRVGGTKKVKMEVIEKLQPDLIIGNKEENEKSDIEHLQTLYPLWLSNVFDLKDALEMIHSIGKLNSKAEEAERICQTIQSNFDLLQRPSRPIQVAYFIWQNPYMVAASNTFIHAMLEEAGFENVFGNRERYPEIQLQDLIEVQPDFIFLSSEPFPFKERHFAPFRKACPNAEIKIVDGELFSWYGSRLIKSPVYFQQLIQEMVF